MRAWSRFSLLLIFALLLVACGGEVASDPTEAPTAETAEETEAESETTSSEESEATEADAELIPIRIGSIAGASQAYIPILMEEQGIDEKYGLDVELVTLSSTGQQWTGLRSGDFDLASGSFLDLLRQREGGLEARAIRPFIKFQNPIVTAPDQPYEELPDLAGAAVGTPSTSLLDWMIIRAVGVQTYDFDIETDAEPVNAAPPLMTELLSNGELDAAFQFATFTIEPLADGTLKEVTSVPELMQEGGFDPESFYLTYNLADSWREEHPGAVPQLIAAMDEAAELLMTDDSVWPDLAAESGVTDPEDLENYMREQRESFDTTFSRDKIDASQSLLDSMIEVVGEEAVGATEVDPEAFDFESYEAAQELRQ